MMKIDEIREWLNEQKRERISSEGLREIAKSVGVHENTLYGICKGRAPNYSTAAKLREYIEARDGC